jgi:hypothetical protein
MKYNISLYHNYSYYLLVWMEILELPKTNDNLMENPIRFFSLSFKHVKDEGTLVLSEKMSDTALKKIMATVQHKMSIL